tara:strand:+ start:669 stop:1025 length:357 start_codon:yes stop_codon:yes gene_type:complete
MSEKEVLISTVKSWLDIDNQLKELQSKIKEKRNEKKELSKKLVSIMNVNDLDSMATSQGQLIKTTSKVKAPLSKKHLNHSLSEFFKNDPKIVDALSKFIMDSRDIKIKENIRRKMNKN